ncbi:FG-GAP repeat domain-containing protein [Streptomyces sp. NPDC020983]|uniref:FG-GAP repeat domain-containing protein n=1 Tax=Streptomyces sp. NPDC020983 TaxID=3365106 RepID=UPI0037A4F128
MSESQPARVTSRRLVAVCTAGILSLGAFALGTSAQAAEPGAHSYTRPDVSTSQVPHFESPWQGTATKSPKLTRSGTADAPTATPSDATGTVTPAPQRYDVDGDGIGDQLFRAPDGTLYNSLATPPDAELPAAPEQFVDLLTPGDLDGAAGPEVLATTATGKLEMFTAANFPNNPSWTGSGWGAYNKLVATDDLTGDGKADIIARDYSGKLWLYAGTGSASAPFEARALVGSGWGIYDQLTSPGDLNADGISDLVGRASDGTLYFYAGTGVPSAPYAARTVIGKGWNAYNQLVGLGNGPSGKGGLFARTTDGTIYTYLSNGAGNFSTRQPNGTGWTVDLFAGSGGIPAWGKKELLGETSDGTLWWYGADNAGHFTPRVRLGDPGGWAGQFNLTFASALTSDGRADLLERYGSYLYNDFLGVEISSGWGSYNLVVGPGDLSNDGKGDLLARATDGKLYLIRGTGNAQTFSSRILVGSGWGSYNTLVGAGDLSGDGRADLLARDSTGTLWLYKGTGNSAAPFAARVKISSGWGGFKQLAAPGDMDGDGRSDLLVVDSTGTAYYYPASGTGGFKARVKVGTGWGTYKRLF